MITGSSLIHRTSASTSGFLGDRDRFLPGFPASDAFRSAINSLTAERASSGRVDTKRSKVGTLSLVHSRRFVVGVIDGSVVVSICVVDLSTDGSSPSTSIASSPVMVCVCSISCSVDDSVGAGWNWFDSIRVFFLQHRELTPTSAAYLLVSKSTIPCWPLCCNTA